MSDTRKDKRAPVALKVRFKSATVDEFMEQYARDISRGGLFIKSKSPMPVGTLLKFEVQLKDESPVIRGVGRVVWKREPQEAAGSDAPSGMGIKFIRMDAECRAFVEKIVSQRGEAPGQFEAGGHSEDSVPPPPARPSTKSERPRQVTASFFPAAGPSESELPLPEDRTQVRHASEFLASALAEVGDTEAAREAERKAEEARRRSEEIERERAERARESERPKPQPVTTKAPSSSPASENLRSSSIPPAGAPASTPAAGETPLEANAKLDVPEKREPSKRIPVAARDLVDDRPPPVEEPSSYLVPAIIGVLAVIAIGYFAVSFGGGGSAEPAHETPRAARPSTDHEAPRDEATSAPNDLPEPPPTVEAAAEIAENPDEIAENPGSEPRPAETPVPTVRVRIETAPPGAIITIDGSERGASPVDIEAPIGTALSVSARLAGHRVATQEITPSRTMRPIRMQLAALPYVIEVSTSPPGARVRAGGRIVTAAEPSSRVSIPRPSRPVQVSASFAGHLDANQTVSPHSFTERDGEMVASIMLTLRVRPTPVRPPPTTSSPTPGPATTEPSTSTPSPAAPEPEATTEEAPEAPPPPPAAEARPSPPPDPEPEAEEAPPDNPF